jgi:phosphate transport system protein
MVSGVRSHFEKQLAQLNEEVLRLGSLARQAVSDAMRALANNDPDLAREVISADLNINSLRFELERRCYELLVTEQPVARDMRIIVSALTVTNDLERIGDHGKKIAKIYLRMLENPRPIPMGDIQRLGEMALNLLARALEAYAADDAVDAQAVCLGDDAVDALYKQTFNIILSYMLENPRLINSGTHLIQVAHELERVADRATNIAERVIYTSTGELVDLNV